MRTNKLPSPYNTVAGAKALQSKLKKKSSGAPVSAGTGRPTSKGKTAQLRNKTKPGLMRKKRRK